MRTRIIMTCPRCEGQGHVALCPHCGAAQLIWTVFCLACRGKMDEKVEDPQPDPPYWQQLEAEGVHYEAGGGECSTDLSLHEEEKR